MKKYLLLLAISFAVISSKAQLVPTYSWAGKIAGSGYETSWDMETDAAGNVFIIGNFDGTCDFDPGTGVLPKSNTGWVNSFFAKYTANGNLIWVNTIEGNNGNNGYALDLDANGNVYITGTFGGQVDMDPGPGIFSLSALGGDDIYFAKYDSSGNFIWAKGIGESGYELVSGIKTDGNTSFYLTGHYGSDSLDLDPGPGFATQINTNFSNDPFLAKYDSSGNFVWGFGLEGNSDNSARSIAVDAAQNVIVGGYYYSTMTVDPVGGTSLTSSGFSDCYVVSYSSSGIYNWSASFGGAQFEFINSLATAGTDVFVSGNFAGSVDFDPGPDTLAIQSKGFDDIFLCKLNNIGELQWAHGIGGVQDDNSTKILINPSGAIYLSGYFTDSADFATGVNPAQLKTYGGRDGFLAKYDNSGNYVWALKIGSSQWDHSNSVAYDNTSDEVWVSGYFDNANCYVDPMNTAPPLISSGGQDVFFAKYGECSYPVNTAQPNNEGLCPNSNASFSVNFTGNNLTYQWQEGTNGGTVWTDVVDGGVYSGATTLNLVLTGVTTAFNNRFYRCKSTESCGLSLTSGIGILFVTQVDTSVSVNQHILVSNATTATYQWLDCNNALAPIAGATAKQFIASVPGSYALEVTKNGCTDTSACYTITTIGLNNIIHENDVQLFPVPAKDKLVIQMNQSGNYEASLYDISGKRVLISAIHFKEETSLDVSNLENGMYLVGLRSAASEESFFRIVVNK